MLTRFKKESILILTQNNKINLKNQIMTDQTSNPAQSQSKKTTERISLVINQDENGRYELIEKPFKGNEKALQFPCKCIETGGDSLSAAHKALVKGDQFQQQSHLERFMYQDQHGQKEVFIYRGTLGSFPMSQGGKYKTIYLQESEILNSALVTDLSKEAFQRYLKYQKS